MRELVVIGGGASGIAAALTAAENAPEVHITILEAQARIGKKILVSGNGRCNLTNTKISPARYHSSDPKRLKNILADMPAERTLRFFQNLGLYCIPEQQGCVYPHSEQAGTVLDTLLLALRQRNIRIVCNCKVDSIYKDKNGNGFTVLAGEAVFHADAVILAAGGCAAPKHGGNTSGYELAKSLGHGVTPLRPCLGPLQCIDPALNGLKGVRARGSATLFLNGNAAATEYGELQFAQDRLSGILIFQLSCLWQPDTSAYLAIDLLPEWNITDLSSFVHTRAETDEPLETFLPGLVHKRLLYAAMKRAGLAPLSRQADSLKNEEVQRLCEELKNWRLPVTGPSSWEYAQVTGGGVPLDEVDDQFTSMLCPGLWLTGELLDVVGDCGGYNLHWAWCSGMLAGRAAAEKL